MATIRTRFRGMFAICITLLLVLCSLAIWFWARYIIHQQAEILIQRDVNRLATEIAWQPQLEAFELLTSPAALRNTLSSQYWQISDAEGRIVWKSDTWRGYKGAIPFGALSQASPAFEVPSPTEPTGMLASARDVRIDESSSRTTDLPEAVRRTLSEVAPNQEIVVAELEYEDDQFKYEVITRQGEVLVELEISEGGRLLRETRHPVPTALPLPVREAFERAHPGAKIDLWRASPGYLLFIVTGTGKDGVTIREAVNSSGQPVALSFPDEGAGRPVGRFRILVADEQQWRHGLFLKIGWTLAGVCGSGLIAAWLLSVWLADRALQPMGEIARKARMIDERRLSDRLEGGHKQDEIGLLAQAINGMLDRIERAFERQRRFARDASHELRGPLTGLISQLELARGQLAAPGPATAHLDRALERGQRLRDLIDKLLLLARQESDQPVSMRDDIDIDECMANVVAEFPDGQRERLRVTRVNGHGEARFVHGNEELLHAMFRNVVDNALKFSGAGRPVQVAIESSDGYVGVEVRDQGPGIPSAARDRIFEPFVRLRDSATAPVEGSGLGLSIVKWIADLHQAKVQVASEPGEGTRFRIVLPEAREGHEPDSTG